MLPESQRHTDTSDIDLITVRKEKYRNQGTAREKVRVAHALSELPMISAAFREGRVFTPNYAP